MSTLADKLEEIEAATLCDTGRDAHALVDTLAHTLAEVMAVTLGDTPGDAQALVDTG